MAIDRPIMTEELSPAHTNHLSAPPRRGVVARRSVRVGDSSDDNDSTFSMVRISSRATQRQRTLLPKQRSRRFRYLVWIGLVSLATVGSVLLYFGRQRDLVEVGPDGDILRVVRDRHHRSREDIEEESEQDDSQGDDTENQEEEGDDGTTEVEETQDDTPEEEEEEETQQADDTPEETQQDDETDDGTNMKSPILPAHRVLSLGIPYLIYGTAWKKDETAKLVHDAVTAGFRFIDTACQPKHYNEAAVGDGWTSAANELSLERRDIFLQTKYTSVSGQDPNNIPYDPNLPKRDQVWESLQVSLKNLRTNYLDSWVMHGVEPTMEATMEVYRTMEQAVDEGKVMRLGVSNCYSFELFREIYDNARIKPEVLQNRFYEDSNWDQELRAFCKEKDIWYQSFWTLTANRQALHTQEAKEWAAEKDLTPQTLLYAYLMSLGYGTPLDGTTNYDHMVEDVAVMQRIQKEFQDEDAEDRVFDGPEDLRKFEQLLGF